MSRLFLFSGNTLAMFQFQLVTALLIVSFSTHIFSGDSEGVPYTVICDAEGRNCKVDKSTYIGWRTYHASCHVCHAQDAVGSTFAPSLLDRLKGMEEARFLDIVSNGITGEVGVMPGWGVDPNVMPRINDLWSYLKARSDGVLGPGKPKKIP